MERRGCGLGCIIAWLALALAICLLPYLVSSIYSIVSITFEIPTPASWLYWDWIGTWPLVSENQALYMLLAQGPMCCGGILALLFVVLGAVMMITGTASDADVEDYFDDDFEDDYDEDEYDYDEDEYDDGEEYEYEFD